MNKDSENGHLSDGLESLTADGDGGMAGVPSGFPRLDNLTGGWQESELIVVGSRPSMGKTSFALSGAQHAVADLENPVNTIIFSLEMSGPKVAERLIASRARVDAHKARTSEIDEEDERRLSEAAGELHDSPLHIDDTPGLSVEEIADKCRRLQEKSGIGLVVVDYLQLLQPAGRNLTSSTPRENRERELGDMTRALKALSKELDVPIIVLSQLNREVENRGGDMRPRLTDLRGSGSIEQDADVVAFIYRAERYGITVDERGNSTEGIAEIIVAKQRNGPAGAVEMAFLKQYARFEPLAEPGYSSGGQNRGSNSSFEDDAPF